MIPAATAEPPNPAIDPHTGMVHDPDMLQAAQLLLPGDYRPTGTFVFYSCLTSIIGNLPRY
jgi:hypothetical protein